MDTRTALLTTLSAAVLGLVGCGGDDPPGDNRSAGEPTISLEEYAKRDCAIGMEVGEKVTAVAEEMMSKIGDLSAMGNTAAGVAQVFRDTAAKYDELGDPPNGEGKGAAQAGADHMRALADQIDDVSTGMKTAETHDEILAEVSRMQLVFSQIGGQGDSFIAGFKAKYPTPELDAIEKTIPGCMPS